MNRVIEYMESLEQRLAALEHAAKADAALEATQEAAIAALAEQVNQYKALLAGYETRLLAQETRLAAQDACIHELTARLQEVEENQCDVEVVFNEEVDVDADVDVNEDADVNEKVHFMPIAEEATPVVEPEPVVKAAPIVAEEPVVVAPVVEEPAPVVEPEPVVEVAAPVVAEEPVAAAPVVEEPIKVNVQKYGTAVTDLKKAIAIGDRFLFQRELFQGNGELQLKTIEALNNCGSFAAAEQYIDAHFNWDKESKTYQLLATALHRRFG